MHYHCLLRRKIFVFCIFVFMYLTNSNATEIAPSSTPIHIPLTMEYVDNPLIEKSKQQYISGFGKKWLQDTMSKGAKYRTFIQKKAEEYGLPRCIEFLAVIESSYNTNAVSRSGAVGMWQFMSNSVGNWLKINDWVDERRDPWLATDAAMKKLKINYDYFKDWALALGAYNMGLGGMNKAIKKAGSRDFWYLAEHGYVSAQTATYVPRFFAIADLVTNSAEYGLIFDQPWQVSALPYTTIKLERQINLRQLAEDTGISYSIYKYLNPSLKYILTPPEKEYPLRIPEGCNALVSFAATNQDDSNIGITYTVAKGDTLWGIAKLYKTTVDQLCKINKRDEQSILSIGTILIVPILK